jgi:hypothetical protein
MNTLALLTASATAGRPAAKVASAMGVQVPLLHPPPWQPWPHVPQLAPSVATLVHVLPQIVWAQWTQAPPTQVAPVAHWLLLVQLMLQAVAPQVY